MLVAVLQVLLPLTPAEPAGPDEDTRRALLRRACDYDAIDEARNVAPLRALVERCLLRVLRAAGAEGHVLLLGDEDGVADSAPVKLSAEAHGLDSRLVQGALRVLLRAESMPAGAGAVPAAGCDPSTLAVLDERWYAAIEEQARPVFQAPPCCYAAMHSNRIQ